MLELQHVHHHFEGPQGRVHAMQDITFSIKSGEVVSVQGPSGCGKTTLLLTAGTLLRPETGSVSIDGSEPYALDPEKRSAFRSEKIGFVFQQFHLIPYLNVLENIILPSAGTPHAKAAEERAHDMLKQFHMEHRLKHKPGELSAGEKQRTGLARAMINRPPYILADEPTGNLDPSNAQVVLDALHHYSHEGGAVLLVTHDPQAATHADRTLRLENGKIVS